MTKAPTTFIPSIPVTKRENVRVYRTNIDTTQQRTYVLEVLSHIPSIEECWVDIEDCDNVLRVVGKTDCQQLREVVGMLGFEIDELN
jgi:hypothetical protein